MSAFNPQQSLTAAVAHHQADRLADAERLYRQILSQKPDEPDALHLLGVLLGQRGQLDAAVDSIQRAIALRPHAAEFYCNLAAIHQRQQKSDLAAAAAFRCAFEIKPDFFLACISLGKILLAAGDLDEAIPVLRRAAELHPTDADSHNALGTAFLKLSRIDEAITSFRHALDLNPNLADAHNNLGIALGETQNLESAIAAFQYAIRLAPDNPAIYINLAGVLREAARTDEAAAALTSALRLDPTSPAAHYNLGLVLLTRGDLTRGWDEFEWRLKNPTLRLNRNFAEPQWDGSDLSGKTLLIHTEGGFGDALHFARYIPMLHQTGAANATILIECQPALVSLFHELPGITRIVPRGDSLPSFDMQIPFQSLPKIFRTDLTNIPNTVPYLRVPSDHRIKWKDRLPRDNKLNVGLCWSGSPRANSDRRTRTLESFSPLIAASQVRLISLQTGPEAAEPHPPAMNVLDFSKDLQDFADTAALMEHLDLIITVDTSIAHLAGALAKPVWVLIPFVPDFRWLLDRTDSPWYPTMKLFRQPQRGNWQTPVEKLAEELCRLSTSAKP